MNISVKSQPSAAAQTLVGKVALVTGSTSGIGIGIARALAAAGAGANLAISVRNSASADRRSAADWLLGCELFMS